MTGLPVLHSQSEKRIWRSLNGGGPLGRFAVTNGGARAALEKLSEEEGTVHAGLLVSLMDHLDKEGLADTEALTGLVARARPVDCTPSVHAAGMLLARGELEEAERVLSMSQASGEIVSRSTARARILIARGDIAGAREAALDALGSDPSCGEAYAILAEIDPEGGWQLRRNIQQVFDGEGPTYPPGTGRLQELYGIYYEWFRGRRDTASEMLARSRYYAEGDREFRLASARISVDERDWHSARMMYSRLLPDAKPFLKREVAEACIEAGDYGRALELLAECDHASPLTMRDMVRARHGAGEDAEAMAAMRAYLDSEWAGSDEYLEAVRTLIGYGMDREASQVLAEYEDGRGADAESSVLASVLATRAGDFMNALMLAGKASALDRGSRAARVQRARVYVAMGDDVRAGKECAKLLADDPLDADALTIDYEIKMRRGDLKGAEESCVTVLESDPTDTGALLALARIRALSGDAMGASDTATRAVRTDRSRETYVRALSSLLAAGPNKDAIYLCREAEKRFPDEPAIRRIRGNIEYAGGDADKAAQSYSEAVRLDPGDAVSWYSLGMAREALGDPEGAEAAYDRAIAIDRREPQFWLAKAAIREAAGDAAGAERALDTAMSLDTSDPTPLLRRAAIMDPSGTGAQACEARAMADAMRGTEEAPRGPRFRLKKEEGAEVISEEEPDEPPAEGTGDVPVEVPEGIPEEAPAEPSQQIQNTLEDFGPQVPAAEPEPEQEQKEAPKEAPKMEQKPRPEPRPEPGPAPVDAEGAYAIAASLHEAGDHKGALKAAERGLESNPNDPDLLRIRAVALLAVGDHATAGEVADRCLERYPNDPDFHRIKGQSLAASGDLEGAMGELDLAASLGDDSADLHAARGEVFERTGFTDRASECYSAAVSRDPDRLDLAERLARMMYDRRESMAADGMLNRILRRDPLRMSAILLKAEIAQSRKDDKALTAAYGYFAKCPNPDPESTVRMVRILEEAGHSSEAKGLVLSMPQSETAADPVKRNAEKALRKAYSMKVPPTDPDMLSSLGLDRDDAGRVAAYLGEQPDFGPVASSPRFREMEALSREAVMKLDWRDLEHSPRLPLERVFVECGCRDADAAKDIVAYVMRAMLTDTGRNQDPRLSDISMRLPKGMSVYEIMRDCNLGVFEARAVQDMIV